MAVTNPCRICDSIPPTATLFCCCCCCCCCVCCCCIIVCCCCALPPPLLLGTAVAFNSCSLNLPPHSLIRCNSASSKATSFSRVCMRASFVSKMAVRVVLPGTPPGTATLPPRTVPPAPDTLPSPRPALPPATAAPDDAVDAYANSSCVCRLFRLSFVALSSFTTQAIGTHGYVSPISFPTPFSCLSSERARDSFFFFFFFLILLQFFCFFFCFFLGVMLCGGSVEEDSILRWSGAASLTHEICPVNRDDPRYR